MQEPQPKDSPQPTASSHTWRQALRGLLPVRALASSLSLRTAVVITVVALLAVTLFSLYVTSRLTSTVFENRRTVILQDAAIRYSQAHAVMEQSAAASPDQVQEAARQLVENIQNSAASNGAVAVALLRSPDTSAFVRINEIIPQTMSALIHEDLRHAVQQSDQAQWQSVALPTADTNQQVSLWGIFSSADAQTPAIVTGAKVNLPRAGSHELYIVYTLAADQAMVATTMNVFFLATLPFLLFLPFLVFAGIYRLLDPVQRTAKAAASLAEGNLAVRVPVSGEDEMAQLGSAFNDMADSLQEQIKEYDELSQLQQRFVSDVSHELRTPLTTIRMAEEMIWDEKDNLSPVGARSAELLHGQVERFEVMLADLLEISRLDARSAQLEAENTDIRQVITRVVEASGELARRQNVTVSVVGDQERLAAEMDERRIERVLRNLIVNAIEHAEGGPVRVEMAGNDTCIAVRVRDWGVGMSEETSASVFDRFYRADPARARTTGGTGLGLSIAMEDVRLHNGTLQAWGSLGEGSAFLMCLPRSVSQSPLGEGDSPLPLWKGPEA